MGSSGCSPRPKSPPELYGKRRELAKVVMLEREIGFLKEELKSIEKLQPASFCIKEVADYVGTNPEPLITSNKKTRKTCVEKIVASTCHGYSAVAAVAVLLKRLAAVVPAPHPNVVPASHPNVVPALHPNVVPALHPNVVLARYQIATQNARVAVAVAAANVVSHVGQPSAHVLNFRNVLVVVVVA
ncbi:guanine nucleotide-binding protein subunit gamma 3 [Tanacetum coccineum]